MSKYKAYVLGWVIGMTWYDGHEYLPESKLYSNTPTYSKEEAIQKASEIETELPLYVREYLYETPNPQNAKGLIERSDRSTQRIFVKNEPEAKV